MTIFRTTDYLHTKSDARKFEEYFRNQALKSGLVVLEHDTEHIRMAGTKWSFLKYYIRSTKKVCGTWSEVIKRIKKNFVCSILEIG